MHDMERCLNEWKRIVKENYCQLPLSDMKQLGGEIEHANSMPKNDKQKMRTASN
jgi:hypothetical protein